jgi:hypothetical protein
MLPARCQPLNENNSTITDSVCFFQFRSLLAKTGFSLSCDIDPTGTPWRTVRIQIKKKFGVLSSKNWKGRTYRVLLQAVDFDSDNRSRLLKGTDIIFPNSRLVLRRFPISRHDLRHAPICLSDSEDSDGETRKNRMTLIIDQLMTEDERMLAVIADASKTNDAMRQFKKPSNDHLPPGYVCRRCGQEGHHRQFCPTWSDAEFIGLDERKIAYGIPRRNLRKAETTEELKRAMIDPSDMKSWVIHNETNAAFIPLEDPKGLFQKILSKDNKNTGVKLTAATTDNWLWDDSGL